MWMEERNGRYRFVEQYIDPYTEKRKRVSVTLNSKSNQAKKQAKTLLDQKIRTKINSGATDDLITGVTMQTLINEWLGIYKKQVKNATYVPTVSIMDKILNELDPDTLVSKVTPAFLTKILESFLYDDTQNLSNKYVRIIKAKLSVLFHYAVTRKYISSNPVDMVKVNWKRNNKTTKIKDKFLEDDELHQLLDYAYTKNFRYATLIEWLYLTGMRIGEALALNWDDITSAEGIYTVKVTGTLEYKNIAISEQYKSDQTKTAAGMREITLPSAGISLYKKLKELNYDSGDFIFQTSTGSVIQISSLNSFLRTAKNELGIDKPVSSHIFRHTHISKLAELGVPLYVIQNRVGHESSKITQTIYLHVTEQAKKQLNSKLDEL